MGKTDLIKAESTRITEDFLIDARGFRMDNNQDWKNRLRELDELYRGEFFRRYVGETDVTEEQLMVMNLVQVGLDDIGRLVSEALPTVRCVPMSDTDVAQDQANVREQIANTYWERNHGEILVPKLSMDLAGAGAAFVVVSWPNGEEYPCFARIDPRFCYPDVHNGQLQDLMVIRPLRLREASRLFPDLNLGEIPGHVADTAEIIEYYSGVECVQAVSLNKSGNPIKGGLDIVKRYEPGLGGMVPVAFAQLDTYDGGIRGMFDQIASSIRTKNRIIRQVLDYTDSMTYAPFVSKGVLNPDDPPGPNTHYRLDPNVQDAQFGRVDPAGSAPQLFALLDYLDREQRGGTGYPVQRQGEVQQSIASAAFVNSTMGQLTTTVRNLQRLIASLREQLNSISFKVDERHLDRIKPLSFAVGAKKTYRPSKDINGITMNTVTYGAGAGLDRQNADVRVMQHKGAGFISNSTAREQIDYLISPDQESQKIEEEAAESALMQKLLAEAPWQDIAKIISLMKKGKRLDDAAIQYLEEQQSAAEEFTAQGGVPGGTSPGPAPVERDAETSEASLQAGGIPGEAEGQNSPEFASVPLGNVAAPPRR